MSEYKLKIMPDNLDIVCDEGLNLLEAVSGAGLSIEVPCGGKGFCGKCRAKVLSGLENLKVSSSGKLSEASIRAGWILMCQTSIRGDAEILIPMASRSTGQKILTSGLSRDTLLKPAVIKLAVTVPEATILEPLSDWDRFMLALMKSRGVGAGVAVEGQGAREAKRDGIQTESYYTSYTANSLSEGVREEIAACSSMTATPVAQIQPCIDAIRQLSSRLREAGGLVTAVVYKGQIVAIEPGDTTNSIYGIAFDIGTTTVVGYLVDLTSGIDVATASCMNPQVIHGDDVISRINLATEERDGLSKLQSLIADAITSIAKDLCKQAGIQTQSIYDIVLAGNTTMTHLVAGVNPHYLGQYPYCASFAHAIDLSPADVGMSELNVCAKVRLLPNIASFVGADTVGVMLATESDTVEKPTLTIDIGTNGEIVMATPTRILASSCAAGPAFEGGHLSCGMRATQGAIDKVVLGNTSYIHTLGDAPAKGLCGSGLIDALAEMLKFGIIDATGRLSEPGLIPDTTPDDVSNRLVIDDKGKRFVFVTPGESGTGDEVCITQKDIRELQLIKAAMYAGCRILLDIAGVKPQELESVLLAGAFGNYIDKDNALHIGLIPNVPAERVRSVGNAAGAGAKIALKSVDEFDRACEMARKAEFIELANRPDFQAEYVDAMFFENAII